MSTPLSSVAPRSSSLAVPSTQNTAPVVKFRCLFTHDIRRKAKRWQDGFLRYHTFNKRVMVYDNTGYFIGDLHWRAPEGINDGDELELDKGVLIQVCEPLERTETDLSSLYKNKNQASPSRRGDAPPSSVHSAAPRLSVSSQQASRSLNDLLGIKKTPVPQLPSPYEQRHRQKPISMHRLHERPAKRQRISPEPITSGQQDVVNLSDSPPPRRQNTNTQSRQNPHSISQNRRTAVLPAPQLSTGPHSTSETQVPPSSGRPTAQPVSQNLKASSSAAGPSVSTLRLSGSKPRRKLMYQEASLAPVKKTGSQDPLPRAESQSTPND
ncbi:hypothetical protein ASPVEDRAFT_656516 [Aspergillus versicolor CBS 583.65]|uniref:5'-3' DNA helicase ZGRF1-like N-terminal domain-containing protein n=1 Tax=Aspergillus versicolor CBS 583.65 TaxID=1036611 RepID=A0A1L9PKU4_ASPVE|nr:uncharacterized protein ASPVEDRAFT_656516 [Aspergillus versicolor CBS 583.65]OJJ02144.1 hypothetical protein ASPVEDRAFT_656516 [Aspergillus versicolor CBS 583.65]